MPILQIHLFRVYNPQHESDIFRLEAVETERRSRLVYYYYRENIFQAATKYFFSFTSSNKFWTKLTIICQACFHIMTQKMTGLVELNLQWELYIFTLLFSSTGPLWLLVLWTWFNYFLFILLLVSGRLVNGTGQQNAQELGISLSGLAKTCATYSPIMFATSLIFVFIIKK